jgi:OPT family small oligopeptide transporter
MDLRDGPHSSMIDVEQFTFEEIEGVISNKDDPDTLSLTIRSCVIGLLLAIGRSIGDAYFSFQSGQYAFDIIYILLISYPFGRLLAWILPRYQWRITNKWSFSLNPGPFTIKEHVLITFMTVSCYPSRITQLIVMQRIYFPQYEAIQPASVIIYFISMQLFGFGLAGIFRRFLIWPSKMIWPSSLPIVVLFRVLHDKNVDGPNKDSLGRFKFFSLISAGQFIYTWLSWFIMPVLQNFSPLYLINTKDRLLAELTSVNGFGFGALRLDWLSITSYLCSPIVVPRWAQVNLCIGFFLIVWISGPLVYYTNLWDSKNLPIRSTDYLTVNNTHYNLTVVSNSDFQLNRTEYDLYNISVGGVRISAMHIITLCACLAFLPAIFVHTILYHGKWIIQQIRTSPTNRNNDIHCKLMRPYAETPEWCFILLFIVNLIILMIVSHLNHILSWYNVLIAALVTAICLFPFGILEAEAAQGKLHGTLFTYLLLGAYLHPANPSNYSAFLLQIEATQWQALGVLQFLKISHFMKIPPRAVFGTVLISIILSSISTYFITDYVLTSIPNVCTSANPKWSCPSVSILYDKSIFLTTIRTYTFLDVT